MSAVTTTETATKKLSMRRAINAALAQELRRDPDVFLIGEDIVGGAGIDGFENLDAWGGVNGVTKGLVAEFGRDRIIDTPLSETAFMGAAVGAAMCGYRPVAELMFVEFMGVCLDQIMNQGAKARYMFGGAVQVPLTVRTTFGAGVSAAGQHSDAGYALFAHLPGVKVVVPSTAADAKGLLAGAIRDDDLVVFFEHKGLYDRRDEVPEGDYVLPLGVADVKRAGTDLTIATLGAMVHVAMDAAEELAGEGVEVEVVDLRTVSPLDRNTLLASIRKTGRLIALDEDNPRCSVAGDLVTLAATHAFADLKAAPQMITAPHTPVPFAQSLEQVYVPNAERVVAKARELVRSQ